MMLSNLMLLAILFVSTVDVVMRYFFNQPLTWAYDLISLYLMAGLFFFAVSDTFRTNEHVCVDLLHTRMGRRQRHLSFFICLTLAFLVFVLIVQAAWGRFAESWVNNDVVAGAVEWPTWISAMFVAVGLTLLALRVLLRAVGHGLSAAAGRDLIELPPISGTPEAI